VLGLVVRTKGTRVVRRIPVEVETLVAPGAPVGMAAPEAMAAPAGMVAPVGRVELAAVEMVAAAVEAEEAAGVAA